MLRLGNCRAFSTVRAHDKKAKLYARKSTHLRPAITFGPALPEPQLPEADQAAMPLVRAWPTCKNRPTAFC